MNRGTLWRQIRRNRNAYLFIAPFFLLFTVFLLFPILFSFYLSFHSWNGIMDTVFVGFANYRRALTDVGFLRALANTAVYAALTVSLSTTIALLMSVLLNSVHFMKRFYRGVFFLPSVVSLVVVSIVWKLVLNSQVGLWHESVEWMRAGLQSTFGASPAWMSNPESYRLLDNTSMIVPPLSVSLLTMVMVNLWAAVGFSTVIFLAGLQSIPSHLYEAALIDGANAWQCFRRITLPMLRPTIFFVVFMATIDSLQVFVLPNVMTRDSEATMSVVYYLYRNAFEFQRMGYASAIAYILFAITAPLGILIRSRFGQEDDDARVDAE